MQTQTHMKDRLKTKASLLWNRSYYGNGKGERGREGKSEAGLGHKPTQAMSLDPSEVSNGVG